MNRNEYFRDTLKQCENALKDNPEYMPLKWTIQQLQALILIENVEIKNFDKLKKLKIGYIATREMDGYENRELIHRLCVIDNEVTEMLSEQT